MNNYDKYLDADCFTCDECGREFDKYSRSAFGVQKYEEDELEICSYCIDDYLFYRDDEEGLEDELYE